MKEAIAVWKHCLVHFDLFIIFLPNKVAGEEVLGNPKFHLSFHHSCKNLY